MKGFLASINRADQTVEGRGDPWNQPLSLDLCFKCNVLEAMHVWFVSSGGTSWGQTPSFDLINHMCIINSTILDSGKYCHWAQWYRSNDKYMSLLKSSSSLVFFALINSVLLTLFPHNSFWFCSVWRPVGPGREKMQPQKVCAKLGQWINLNARLVHHNQLQ